MERSAEDEYKIYQGKRNTKKKPDSAFFFFKDRMLLMAGTHRKDGLKEEFEKECDR